MTPEGRLKQQVKKLLEEHGFWRAGSARPVDVHGWFYMPVSNGMGTHGIPDFVCCWDGQFFGIETKAPGGKATPNQEMRHDEIRAAKGWVLVADNIESVREFLDGRHCR
jgi:hypothetical protein